MKQQNRAGAFTLIELLVVVGVISIMAALLIPAVNGVRATSLRARCAANMRQIFTGIQLYANDNNGTLPGPLFGGQLTGYMAQSQFMGPQGNLATFIYPYLGYPQPQAQNIYLRAPAFACPAWAAAIGEVSQNLNNPKPEISYIITENYFGYPNTNGPVTSLTPSKLTAVTNPPNSIILNDGDLQNYPYQPMPAKPVHSGMRNYLYFDGHVDCH